MARRVAPERMLALQAEPGRVRNMCILAHVDHGKTTLSDLLVSSNGIISERQAGKLRYLDSTEDEQTRGITMRASAISLLFRAEKRRAKGGGGSGGGGQSGGGQSGGGQSGGGQSGSDNSAGPASAPPAPAALPAALPVAPPTSGGANAGAAAVAELGDEYLVNLIDSPGHIDFCSDVATATRLCDGALVVVDVVEGVCVQTHAVLRQAWYERMRPCLVLNKVDRLVVDLQLDPMETWHRLQRIIEKVNALVAALVVNEQQQQEEAGAAALGDGGGGGGKTATQLEEEWEFSPVKGNVVFASAIDGWGFQLSAFARIWASKLKANPRKLREYLWGDYTLNERDGKVTPHAQPPNAAERRQAQPPLPTSATAADCQHDTIATLDRALRAGPQDHATHVCGAYPRPNLLHLRLGGA